MTATVSELSERRRRGARTEEPSAEDTTVMALPREDVQRRAYERFIARGGSHGADLEDWLEAERELLASRSASSES